MILVTKITSIDTINIYILSFPLIIISLLLLILVLEFLIPLRWSLGFLVYDFL